MLREYIYLEILLRHRCQVAIALDFLYLWTWGTCFCIEILVIYRLCDRADTSTCSWY